VSDKAQHLLPGKPYEIFGLLAKDATPERPFDGFVLVTGDRFALPVAYLEFSEKALFAAMMIREGAKSPESDGVVDLRGRVSERFPKFLLDRTLIPCAFLGKTADHWPFVACIYRRIGDDKIAFLTINSIEHAERLGASSGANGGGGI